MVHARVVQWGNSRGLRIPKPLLEQARIEEDVTLEVRPGEIVIRAASPHPRAGWSESMKALAAREPAPVWPDDMGDEVELPPW
jgi:antitoxin MazE